MREGKPQRRFEERRKQGRELEERDVGRTCGEETGGEEKRT